MLNFRRAGKGAHLVLLHGFMGGGGYWQTAVERWQDSFDVIAPDLPGFAGSSRTALCSSMPAFADAILNFLNDLGVRQFHLLGHSMGGMIAQQLVLDQPNSVGNLVLYGTSSSGALPGRFESVEETISRLSRDGIDRSAQRIAATWFVDGQAAPEFETCAEATRGTVLEAAAAALRAIKAWNAQPMLHTIQSNTLVISGDRDRSCAPSEALLLFKSIPGADLCIVPRAAHAAHLEDPDLFFEAVTRHLRRRLQ
jgi:2-hydroxy-6-oxonona-2,4-dienedioate hydrolase